MDGADEWAEDVEPLLARTTLHKAAVGRDGRGRCVLPPSCSRQWTRAVLLSLAVSFLLLLLLLLCFTVAALCLYSEVSPAPVSAPPSSALPWWSAAEQRSVLVQEAQSASSASGWQALHDRHLRLSAQRLAAFVASYEATAEWPIRVASEGEERLRVELHPVRVFALMADPVHPSSALLHGRVLFTLTAEPNAVSVSHWADIHSLCEAELRDFVQGGRLWRLPSVRPRDAVEWLSALFGRARSRRAEPASPRQFFDERRLTFILHVQHSSTTVTFRLHATNGSHSMDSRSPFPSTASASPSSSSSVLYWPAFPFAYSPACALSSAGGTRWADRLVAFNETLVRALTSALTSSVSSMPTLWSSLLPRFKALYGQSPALSPTACPLLSSITPLSQLHTFFLHRTSWVHYLDLVYDTQRELPPLLSQAAGKPVANGIRSPPSLTAAYAAALQSSPPRRLVAFELSMDETVCSARFWQFMVDYFDWHRAMVAHMAATPRRDWSAELRRLQLRYLIARQVHGGLADRIRGGLTSLLTAVLGRRVFLWDLEHWPELGAVYLLPFESERKRAAQWSDFVGWDSLPWHRLHERVDWTRTVEESRTGAGVNYTEVDAEFRLVALYSWKGLTHEILRSPASLYSASLQQLGMDDFSFTGCLLHSSIQLRLSAALDDWLYYLRPLGVGLRPGVAHVGLQVRTGDDAFLSASLNSSDDELLLIHSDQLRCAVWAGANLSLLQQSNSPRSIVVHLVTDSWHLKQSVMRTLGKPRVLAEDVGEPPSGGKGAEVTFVTTLQPPQHISLHDPPTILGVPLPQFGEIADSISSTRSAALDNFYLSTADVHVLSSFYSGYGRLGLYASLQLRKAWSINERREEHGARQLTHRSDTILESMVGVTEICQSIGPGEWPSNIQ